MCAVGDRFSRKIRFIGAAGALLVTVGAAPPGPATIVYSTDSCGPFNCPAYTVTIRSDGKGIFEGREGHVTKGRHSFWIDPRRFSAIQSLLAPYRPKAKLALDGPKNCREIATDQMTVWINWSDAKGNAELEYYFGCDMDARKAMADAITKAKTLMPIQTFFLKD